MMNKNILFTLMGLCMCFTFESCDNYLDVLPDNRTTISNSSAVSELLVSAYPAGSYVLLSETMSDNVYDLGVSYNSQQPWHHDAYQWMDVYQEGQDTPTYIWNTHYEAIAAANQALESIKELGDTEELKPYKGEALLCRAYAHFILVNLFAKHFDEQTAAADLGIPYPTKPETVVLEDHPRESVMQTYKLIQADLEEALPLMSDNIYSIPKFHFTVQAAHAFAARFYLYMRDYDKSVKHASLALGAEPAIVLRDWKAYSSMDLNTMLSNYTNSTEKANLFMTGALSWYGRCYKSNLRHVTHVTQTKEFYSNGASHPWGYNRTLAMSKLYGSSTSGLNYTPKYKEHFKYDHPGANTGRGYIMQPLITAEEVLLNRAEALIMLNRFDEALVDLNLWGSTRIENYTSQFEMTKESLTLFYQTNTTLSFNTSWTISAEQLPLVKAVIDIRRREFLNEGLRWFDIKRYNFEIKHYMAESQSYITLPPNDVRRILQIPVGATNFGIEPNLRESKNTTEYLGDQIL